MRKRDKLRTNALPAARKKSRLSLSLSLSLSHQRTAGGTKEVASHVKLDGNAEGKEEQYLQRHGPPHACVQDVVYGRDGVQGLGDEERRDCERGCLRQHALPDLTLVRYAYIQGPHIRHTYGTAYAGRQDVA